MKEYKLELTEKQLSTIQKACEFYSRFLAGQWEIPSELQWNEFKLLKEENREDGFWDIRNYAQDRMNEAKVIFFNSKFSTHASYGIGNDELSEFAKIAYDIYRPILEQFSKESKEKAIKNNEEWYGNVYDHPGLTYSEEGRIKVEVINYNGENKVWDGEQQ